MNYTIAILGASGVGKSSYINRLCSRGFFEEHIQNLTNYTTYLTLNTTRGPVNLCIVEIVENLSNRIASDGLILLYDVTNKDSDDFLVDILPEISDKPYVIYATKIDLLERTNQIDNGISNKNNYNVYNPINHILKMVSGSSDMAILEDPDDIATNLDD